MVPLVCLLNNVPNIIIVNNLYEEGCTVTSILTQRITGPLIIIFNALALDQCDLLNDFNDVNFYSSF